MDRAPGFGPGGCGFESCRGRQNRATMADTSDRIRFAARALFAALLGLALLYFAFLLLLSSPIGGPGYSGSGGYVLQRSPVSLPDALSLIRQGRVQLVVIHDRQEDMQFQLAPSPSDLRATPIQEWKANGYAVWLYAADEQDGLVVLSPGESTIGLHDPEIDELFQEIDHLNRVTPCLVAVSDNRPLPSQPVVSSPSDCPLPTGAATMPLSPEEGLAEGIARPPLALAEARDMILEGHVEVLILRPDKYPDGVRRAYLYIEDGNQQLFRVHGVDVLLYDLSRPDSRPVTNSSTTVGLNEAELQSLLGAVREAKRNGKDTQVIDERN